MPSVFKTLANIAVWVLFVNGLLGIVLSAVARLTNYGPAMGAVAAWAVGTGSLFLSVAAIGVRSKLE